MNFIDKMGGRVAALIASLYAFAFALLFGPPAFRARTCDVAFGYRMGGNFAGEVNRMHPASILPGLMDTTDVFRAYGEPALLTTSNTYRGVKAADGSASPTVTAGIIVRPYPTQQTSGGMSASLGAAVPPTSGVADFLRDGYICVQTKVSVAVKKGDPVYVRCAATSGADIQGQYRPSADGTNTVQLTNCTFMGPADANGVAEIEVRAA